MKLKFILLGASRGLGWATYQQLQQTYPEAEFLLSSRKIENQRSLVSDKTILLKQDFSKAPIDSDFLLALEKFEATHIIYFAGGGPYGFFVDKKWSDHMWALTTTFMYPAELLHYLTSQPSRCISLRQVVLIGSSIAEDKPDAMAASYAAAKHALKGLVSTLQLEKTAFRVNLFSPGYMQTDLLPANSEPRQKNKAEDPVEVAKKLIALIEKND